MSSFSVITAWMRCSILEISFSQQSFLISFTHTSFIAWFKVPALEGCLSATLILIIAHKFSTGFKSELFPGQSSVAKLFSAANCFTAFEQWHGAPSCMKLYNGEYSRAFKVSFLAIPHTWNSSLCCLGAKNTVQQYQTWKMPPGHLARWVFHLLKPFAHGLPTFFLFTTNCYRVYSFKNITLDHSSDVHAWCSSANSRRFDFIRGVSLDLRTGLYDLRPNWYLKLWETEAMWTPVPFRSSAALSFFKRTCWGRTVQQFASSADHLGVCFYWPPTFIQVFVTPIIEICNCCMHSSLRTDFSFWVAFLTWNHDLSPFCLGNRQLFAHFQDMK